MSPLPLEGSLRRAAQLVPPERRADLRRMGGRVLRKLPKPVAQEIRGLFGVRWGTTGRRDAEAARDALGLAGRSRRGTAPRGVSGRAAAAVGTDPEAGARLERALGEVDTSRSAGGHRTVVGVMAPDVRAMLEAEGYHTVPLLPGTAEPVARRAEAVVVDLDGFTGLWEGALGTSGVALTLELLASLRGASKHGATCWLVVRGEHRSEIGALLLMRQSTLMPVHPAAPRPRPHFTQDPGDAPHGLADLLHNLDGGRP